MKIAASILITIAIFAFTFWLVLLFKKPLPPEQIKFGVTFSQKYATLLGVDWQENYLAILDDLKPKTIRLIAYWDEIEPKDNIFNFKDLDFQIKEAAKRNIEVILALGQKVPRWPECFFPEWTNKLTPKERNQKLFEYLKKVIQHYQSFQNIKIWQVENEPLFKFFGICPEPEPKLLAQEIALVKSLDQRLVMTTASGEFGAWRKTIDSGADILGVTMYRVVWHRYFGKIRYPFPPSWYRFKAALLRILKGKEKVIVSELQAEPWGKVITREIPLAQQFQYMNLEQFFDNINYARRVGFPEVYLWGGEWWYWLKTKNNQPALWQAAQKVFNP